MILTFQYLSNASSNLFETSEYVYLILNKHIGLQRKNINFGSKCHLTRVAWMFSWKEKVRVKLLGLWA